MITRSESREHAEMIPWERIKSSKELIDYLQQFLEKVFGKDFLEETARKVKPSKPEKYEYLRPVGHRAVRWWVMLNEFKKRGYNFDLRLSAEVEEFMNLLLFAFNELVQGNVINPKAIRGRLRSDSEFGSLIYEVLVASNYFTNGFSVEFQPVAGRVDLYVEKGAVKVYAECKKLRRNREYVEIAIRVLRELERAKASVVLELDFERSPQPRTVEKVVDEIRSFLKGRIKPATLRASIKELPSLTDAPLSIPINWRNVEYSFFAAWMGVFDGILKIREPKVLVLRNANKMEELRSKLEDQLGDAHDKFKHVPAEHARWSTSM
ncbi:MAG: hypothetical protein ACTSUS_08120 [Candidatus Freyarchaeota archaeon]